MSQTLQVALAPGLLVGLLAIALAYSRRQLLWRASESMSLVVWSCPQSPLPTANHLDSLDSSVVNPTSPKTKHTCDRGLYYPKCKAVCVTGAISLDIEANLRVLVSHREKERTMAHNTTSGSVVDFKKKNDKNALIPDSKICYKYLIKCEK